MHSPISGPFESLRVTPSRALPAAPSRPLGDGSCPVAVRPPASLRRACARFRLQLMRVAILPSGALLVDTAPGDDEASDALSTGARTRIARAFARGTGHGLLLLGASEVDTPLPPPL